MLVWIFPFEKSCMASKQGVCISTRRHCKCRGELMLWGIHGICDTVKQPCLCGNSRHAMRQIPTHFRLLVSFPNSVETDRNLTTSSTSLSLGSPKSSFHVENFNKTFARYKSDMNSILSKCNCTRALPAFRNSILFWHSNCSQVRCVGYTYMR